MTLVSILAAAAAAYAFGAIWYMALAKPWMAAAGLSQDSIRGPDGKQSPMPFVISAIAVFLVAGMMRHIFDMSDISGLTGGALSGLGVGVFLVFPWIMTNYAYGMRPRNLTLIDGGYAIIGNTLIGLVLGVFTA